MPKNSIRNDWKLIESFIDLRSKVLDIGCGEGLFANIVFDEKIETGIDPNLTELERANELGGYSELLECNGNNIPKPETGHGQQSKLLS